MRLPQWRHEVYLYWRDPVLLRKESETAAPDLTGRVAYRYVSRREALRIGLDIVRAALRPDPSWSR